jgi:diacylglycerol kinase family enzyme
MKHLFIINPQARELIGHVDEIEDDIKNFFKGNSGLEYSIHICRWQRDASGYTLRYLSNAAEMVRVYAMGGNGTLFEVVNGVVGLPNAQVAWYPLGNANSLLYAFGGIEYFGAFQSLRNLSLSPVVTLDTIRAGNHYITISAVIGAEAEAFQMGETLARQIKLPESFCQFASAIFNAMTTKKIQSYYIEMEQKKIEDTFQSILIANIPSFGAGRKPAVDALFNDGYMDLYTIKNIPKSMFIPVIRDYEKGNYKKWPEYISHYRCKRLRISSASSMTISLDGNFFYDNSMEFEMCPHSLDFVCPPGVKVPVNAAVPDEPEQFDVSDEWLNGVSEFPGEN